MSINLNKDTNIYDFIKKKKHFLEIIAVYCLVLKYITRGSVTCVSHMAI